MRQTVYIETTIPSYYCYSARAELASDIARTRAWWDEERQDYECFSSAVVLEELAAGNYPSKADCLALVSELPLLDVTEDVLDIAETYQARGLMPRAPSRDAVHLALASYYEMAHLLTWNCRHLANANKIRHLSVLNQGMGLSVPALVTPYMLRRAEDEP